MTPRMITYDAAIGKLSWPDAVETLRKGHLLPKAQVGDIFLGPAAGTMLSRGAYVEGLGYGLKSVTVFPGNPQIDLPSVQGGMFVFEPEHGQLETIIDSKLVTEIKTAADSVLGARLLARPDSQTLLIVGAGTVARSLIKAYSAALPGLRRIALWSRRAEQSQALAQGWQIDGVEVVSVSDLAQAAGAADIIATATMATTPILQGAWITPGTHIDLIGAFKPDMREADDALISAGPLFVDSRETTIHHIGELMIPIANGVITADSVKADFYDLVQTPEMGRANAEQITLFKNGGGAHLDLMIARYISGLMAL